MFLSQQKILYTSFEFKFIVNISFNCDNVMFNRTYILDFCTIIVIKKCCKLINLRQNIKKSFRDTHFLKSEFTDNKII